MELINLHKNRDNRDRSSAGSHRESPLENISAFDNAEEHYRDLIENASDIIYQTDLEGNFVFVNRVAVRIMEYPEEELLEMNYLDLVTPAYKEKVKAFYEDQLSSDIGTTYLEFEAETKSGEKIWFGQNVRTIERDGKAVGFQAMARNITERHNAEVRLKRNEERFRLFVKNTPAAVAMFDRNMCYMAASSRWVEEYGLEEEDIIGTCHYDLFPDISENWIEMFEVGLSGISQKNHEERIEKEDGTTKWIKCEIHPWWKQEDKAGGIIVFTEDITNQKETEMELLKARTEAEKASAAKSNFIASMSHEFRTPLNAVIGFAEVLKTSEGFDKKQKELLDQIHENGSQLLSMINDVLDISRIETSRINYEESEFAVERLVNSSVKPFLEGFQDKGLSLKAEINGRVPRYISSDFKLLEQIVKQLISNALKFTETGSVDIEVDYREWDRDASGTTGMLFIRVIDTGMGFDPEDSDRIFKPFTKLHDHGFHGTGLGLTVVKRFTRFLGGSIDVGSNRGEGSTFEVSVPVKMLIENDKKVEIINFSEGEETDKKTVTVSDVVEFIENLGQDRKKIILEAMELQKLDEISRMDEDPDFRDVSGNAVFQKLTQAARTMDFMFLNKVLEKSKDWE